MPRRNGNAGRGDAALKLKRSAAADQVPRPPGQNTKRARRREPFTFRR